MSLPDRRAQRRESTHRAIAAAALQLIVEQGAEGLSVAELARRAEVSRRTVFNHYSSIEEAAVAQTLWELDELSETIPLPQIPDDAALPVVVARLVEAFVASPASLELILWLSAVSRELCSHPAVTQWGQRTVEHAVGILTERTARLRPGADPLQVRILCLSLVAACAAALDDPARCAGPGGAPPEDMGRLRERTLGALRLLAGLPPDLGAPADSG